ncbi:flavodoxin domain-containing protein [Nocardioides sp. NPDC127514]|uniref:flavodoxin family protein n=1 Tax=unclassified Nocardioides TaxID=2615069 RepID=UPI00331C4B72
MRAAVVYESMFGNTATIATSVANGLRKAGIEVKVIPVTLAGDDVLRTHDLVVIGAPTHALGMSRPNTRADAVLRGAPAEVESRGVREWLEKVQDAEHVHLAAFDTRARSMRHLPGSAARHVAHLLRRRGYDVPPAASFYVSSIEGPLAHEEEARAGDWATDLGHQLMQQVA